MKNLIQNLCVIVLMTLTTIHIHAQELDAKVVVNSQKLQGTSKEVFTNLETTLTEFMNTRKWTNQQYRPNERITCSFNITVNQYNDDGSFVCEMMVQSSRPVFNSNYTTTVFNFKDTNFAFNYKEFDQLEFKEEVIDNNLTAVMAYYALLIIGMDMDTFSPQGGT